MKDLLRLCVGESELVRDCEPLPLLELLQLPLPVRESLLLHETLPVREGVHVAVELAVDDAVKLIVDLVIVLDTEGLRLPLWLWDFVPLKVPEGVPLREQLPVGDAVEDAVRLVDPLRLPEGEDVPLDEAVLDTLALPVDDTVRLLVSVREFVLEKLNVSELRLAEAEGEAVEEDVADPLTVRLELLEMVHEKDSEPLPLHVGVRVCEQLAEVVPDGEAVMLPLLVLVADRESETEGVELSLPETVPLAEEDREAESEKL